MSVTSNSAPSCIHAGRYRRLPAHARAFLLARARLVRLHQHAARHSPALRGALPQTRGRGWRLRQAPRVVQGDSAGCFHTALDKGHHHLRLQHLDTHGAGATATSAVPAATSTPAVERYGSRRICGGTASRDDKRWTLLGGCRTDGSTLLLDVRSRPAVQRVDLSS
jgi:hypothetical protein